MAKYSSIPTGGKFLPGHTRKYLLELYRNEKNVNAAQRIMAYAKRKEGLSIRGICADMDRSYSTVRGWLQSAAERGINGRYKTRHPGTSCRMELWQLKQLRSDLIAGPEACGYGSGAWTGLPVSFQLGPANVHDSKMFRGVLDGTKDLCGRRIYSKIRAVLADKGYDTKANRRTLNSWGLYRRNHVQEQLHCTQRPHDKQVVRK